MAKNVESGDYQVQMDQSKVKTIEQLTPKGLDTAVEYYNQKYPDRGKIGRVQLLMDDLLDHRPNLVKKACEDLSTLRKQGCNKIAISIARKNPKSPSGISLDHSTPFVLTNDKLILMRDEHDSFGQPLFEEIAANLGVKFVQSSPPIYDKTDPKRTSIQGDYASCHFIALGVLKDLTKEDLQTVSGFKNGFDHLAKSLKYSQSASHIKNTLDEESAKDPVKKDGRTAEQYAKQHKKVTEDGIATRVNDKFNRFKSTLSETTSDLRGESAISDVAGEVLKEYSAAKAGNAQKSFVEKFNLQPKSREPLAKRKDPESTSYVEKIRAAKDQGRSNGGSNEL